ncbi:Uncharacterised protein [Klebsiella oxytoca]|nr:Uncharacterised protein [Klebsiella oxytoca]
MDFSDFMAEILCFLSRIIELSMELHNLFRIHSLTRLNLDTLLYIGDNVLWRILTIFKRLNTLTHHIYQGCEFIDLRLETDNPRIRIAYLRLTFQQYGLLSPDP